MSKTLSKSASKGEPPGAKQSEKPTTVVGVGASAGGLEALQIMVSNLPADTGMCFLIAQHLSPNHKSMMVELLEKSSPIPICTASDGTALRANTIFVCPPNHNIELTKDDHISLTASQQAGHIPSPSVDVLFESIASCKREDSIGIVLSGTGSDGSRGIRAIKEENGFGIVQDPSTAKYDGMPNSAINSGNVDLIVPPDQIGDELKNILMFPRERSLESEKLIPRQVYNSIIRLLKLQFKVDFSLYKENTILRRIERRMISLKIAKAEDYLDHLSNNQGEVQFLYNDMLIGVTSFFRDPRAYDMLKQVLRHYIASKKDKVIRIWSAGCSTGEEPYTIAMILSQILGTQIDEYKIQIFATDIDEHAISFGRQGVYPESALHYLPKEVRQKFFTVRKDQFEVIKPIKSMVIFSMHDVNKDPPFLRLDLISCRNLLIYFTTELQRMLLPTFHYALNPGGLLMLGLSESIGLFQEQYRVVSKSAKIYEAVFVTKILPPERRSKHRDVADYVDPATLVDNSPAKEQRSTQRLEDDYADIVAQALRDQILPNALLVNENQDIVFSEGKNPLLIRPNGVPTNNLFKNIHPDLVVDLRSAMHDIEAGKSLVDTGFMHLKLEGEDRWVRLLLISVQRQAPLRNMVAIFCSVEEPFGLPPVTDIKGEIGPEVVREQERQLQRTREQLQNVIEELETSNEEMQSVNEELQSSNEELQSSNEELETTNEELQSTNEELQTAYAELRMAYDEKEQQQAELLALRSNLIQANTVLEEAEKIGRTGSWMWDLDNRSLTWSNGCYRLFGLNADDFHPSFEAFIGLAHPMDRNQLETQLKEMLVKRIDLPIVFRAANNSDGLATTISLDAVVSFNDLKQATKVMGTMTDITEKVRYEKTATAYKDKINYILNSSLNCAYIFDFEEQNVHYVNPTLTQEFGYSLDDMKDFSGEHFYTLFPESERKKVHQHFERVRHGTPGATYPAHYSFANKEPGTFTPVYANHTVYDLDESNGLAQKMLVTFFPAEERSEQ